MHVHAVRLSRLLFRLFELVGDNAPDSYSVWIDELSLA